MGSKNEFEHELVPNHRVLSKDEVKKLLDKLKISINHLPRILDTDPVIQTLGAKVGDVIEVTRKSQTSGTTLYYRLVIEE